MKVGFTMNFRNVLRRPWREFWEDNLWLLTEAEAMGFDYLGIQEHFFAKDGYSPSVPVFLATLIERTKTIRIGSYLYLLPFHHAAQLAQETAVLDHMSGGRLDVTVGQGHMAQEYRAWGYSPKTRPSRFEEGLTVLRAAWTERPFSFHGRYYDIDDLTVLPEPLQQPHPPLWIGGSTEKSAYRAGRFGAHFAAVSGDRTVYDAYLRGLVDGSHDPAGAQIAGAWIVTCTHEDPKAVWQRNKAHYHRRWTFYDELKTEMGDPALDFGFEESAERFRNHELIGPPEVVTETLRKLSRDLPLTHVMLGGFADGIPVRDEAYRSLKLFADEVLPIVKGW